MKKLLLFLLLLAPLPAFSQAVSVSTGLTVSAATTGSGLAVPTTYFHQVVWSVVGNPATCTFTVDSSADNSSWSAGGVFASQSCAGSGSSGIVNIVTGYVRINVTAFTGPGSIKVTYTGFTASGSTGGILGLTAGRVPYAATGSSLIDAAGFTFDGTNLATPGSITAATGVSGTKFLSATNCADSAGAAACGSASAGAFVVDAAGTSTVVSTTAVTANSQVFLQIDVGLGTRLSVTCNTQAASVFNPRVTARTAGASFTVTIDAGPTTNPLCIDFLVVN